MGVFREQRFLPPRELEPAGRERLISRLRDALSRHPEVVFAYVHGSFVKEDRFRDIDIGVYLDPSSGTMHELDLSRELSDLVSLPVDVKAIQDAPLPFQMAVLRDGLLLSSRDEDLRTDFIERTSKRYPEYAHFRNVFLGIDGVRSR